VNDSRSVHPVELALGEVGAAAMHEALAADPMRAVEVAEVRDLFARFEPLQCESSPVSVASWRAWRGVRRRASRTPFLPCAPGHGLPRRR